MPHRPSSQDLLHVGVAVLATSLTTAILILSSHATSIPNGPLLYVPVILFTAISYGTGPSLIAAILAALQYDFFLVTPVLTFSIGQAQDALSLAVFVAVAVVTGQLAGNTRERAEAAQRRATESQTLYDLSQALMLGQDVDHVLKAITERVAEVFRVDRCAIFVPGDGNSLTLAAETMRGRRRDRASLATATYVYTHGEEIGLPENTSDPSNRQRLYVPLRAAGGVVGVMEVGHKQNGSALDDSQRRLVFSFAAQAALVLARAIAEQHQSRLRIVEESDTLKSALLNAVSHDLRTPLSSIKASATALLLADTAWSLEERREMLEVIDHEADRLNRLVGNLLDLSRIEAGVLKPAFDLYTANEVMDAVIRRIRPLMGKRTIEISIDDTIPPLRVDLVRIEELMLNLVENALKYAPLDTPLHFTVRGTDGTAWFSIVDHGPGIPADRRDQVFEPFYRLGDHGDRHPGTGLGLAIARGIVQSHGGQIRIQETSGGGTTVRVGLPFDVSAVPL